MNTHAAKLTTEALLAEAGWIRGLALHLTRDPDRADDVAQETLLRAIARPPVQAPAPRAWLATVATNLVRSAGRQDRRRRLQPLTGEERSGAESGGTPEQLLERMQLQRLLADLLLALDEPYREVVLLRYIEGLSSQDIATRLNVAPGTVRWRLKTGLDQLRRELDRAHGGERERWRRMLIPFAALAPDGFREEPPPAAPPPRPASAVLAAFVLPGLAALVALFGWALVRLTLEPVREQAARLAADGPPRPGPLGLPAELPTAGGVFAGRVIDGTGQGVPGAVVTALVQRTRPHWAARPIPGGPLPSAVADGDGHYRLAGLPPGSYGISAHSPGRGVGVHGPLAVTGAAEPITVDLKLARPGAVARGRVLDESGGPVPGARVLALAPERLDADVQFIVQARSDDQGRFQLEVAARENHLQADAPGYAPETQVVDLEGLAEVIQDLRLLPAGGLAGAITAQGQPLEAAEVAIDLEDGQLPEPVRVTTDAGGRFAAENLAPGRYRVTGRKGLLVSTPVLTELTGGQLRELGELPVSPGAALRGRVVGPQGAGVPDADVSLEQARPGASMDRLLAHALTDADGRFLFEGLRPGRYNLSMSGRNWTFRQQTVDVPATGTAAVEIQARVAARVGGIVVGPDGMAVAGAQLIARVAPRDQSVGLADRRQSGPDGRFTLHNLAPGVMEVVAMHGQQIAQAGPVEVLAEGAVQLTLRLAPAAQVSGVVRYRNGKPVVAMRVTGRSRSGPYPNAPAVRTDSEGRFTIGPFLPGDATIGVIPRGSMLRLSAVERPEQKNLEGLRAGEHRRGVDFTLPLSEGKLAGRLLGPGGEPQVGLVVHAGAVLDPDSNWLEEHRAVTDGEGIFQLEGLPDAPHALRATHAEWPAATLSGLRPGRKDIELRFVRGAVLSGEVRDSSGRPPRDFRVVVAPHEGKGDPPAMLVQELGRARLEVHDGSGQFVLPRLPAGLIDVHVITPDGRTGRSEAISLTSAKQARVRITLAPTLTVRGRVLKGQSGEPAVGWEVRVLALREWLTTVTDASGRFVLPGLFGEPRFHIQAGPPEGGFGDGFVVYRDRGADQDIGILRALTHGPDESSPGVIGLQVERRPEGQVVAAAVPGLPAARAGLAAGDRLVAVDGRNIGELGHWSVRDILRGAPGSVVRLTVERAGQPSFVLNLTRVPPPTP